MGVRVAAAKMSWEKKHLRGGGVVHRRRSQEHGRESPGDAREEAEEVAEYPELAPGRCSGEESGDEEGRHDARKGHEKSGPLNEGETLLGESNREPYGSKERRRIEKHGHVGCGREPEAFGHEEEFAHEAEAHERDVAEPDVPVPFLMEEEAVGDEEQNRSRSGAQANLQHGTDVRPGSLDGSLLHAPGHGEENADEKGAKVDGPADGSSWESHD